MTTFQSSYDFINDKIKAMKDTYPSLRNKPNDYVFSALCVKSIFYKNPALILNESDFVTGERAPGAPSPPANPSHSSARRLMPPSQTSSA